MRRIERSPHEGRLVRCKAIGDKPEFTGVIEATFKVLSPEFSGLVFHVRDPEDGTLWHRSFREVSFAPQEARQ